MSLRTIDNNRAVARQLLALLESGKLVHAFLFIGPREGRLQIARALAQAILCEEPQAGDLCGECVSCRKFSHGNHEDFLYLDLESAPGNAKTQIGVDAVEMLQDQLKLKPFGVRHVVLIEEAHLLNAAAQNKLLKTLEEPAGDTVIILLAQKKDALLSTVVSRCSTYFLEEGACTADGECLATARNFFALCAKAPHFYRRRDCLKAILDDKNDARGKALLFLELFEQICTDALLAPYKTKISPLCDDWDAFEEICAAWDEKALQAAVAAAEEAGRCLRLGYNTGYTLKRLCLTI